MEVKIKRIEKDLPLPKLETEGAVGFDLYSRINVVIRPGEYYAIPSNLIIETPEKYMLITVARSSTFKRTGLILPNAIGIFDQDFCGDTDEMLIQVYNLGTEKVEIMRGDRIAQGIFVRIDTPKWIEVDKMKSKSRGGLGTTGYKIIEVE